MKQIMTISAALLFLTIGEVQAQNGIEQVLKNIETNNKELQANEQLITSQKLEAKTDNNLPDPTLSYAHLWGAKDKSETIGELVVSQSFDFPSLYATRNKLNRLKAGAFDSQSDVFRQEKLLQAKELCLDIIMLRQQKHILEERLRNAEELAKMYAKRLQTGDANALETNKINLELLNVRTEASLNETALRNKQQELNTLNGNIPVVFEENQYPAIPFPSDYQILKSEVMATDRTLMALGNESLVARKQIAVNKSQWLPKLELGYRRNTVLKNGTDYTVSYSNNKKVGKATVKITGKGKYGGVITKTFKINPAKQKIQKLTAKSKAFFIDWAQKGSATGYEIQYATNSKFTSAKKVTITNNKTDKTTVSKLSANKKYYVRVRSDTTVKGTKYYGAWSATKTVTTKK